MQFLLQQQDVDILIGPTTNFVMMKTTTLIVIGTMVLAATTLLKDGTNIAKFVNVLCQQQLQQQFLIIPINHKSLIRSRPCIILNPKFPRLVLEVFKKYNF